MTEPNAQDYFDRGLSPLGIELRDRVKEGDLNDDDLVAISIEVEGKRGLLPDYNAMGNEIHKETTLHVSLGNAVRVNSGESDGPVRLRAHYAGQEGTHAVSISFGVQEWYAGVYTRPEEAEALVAEIQRAIVAHREAEAIMADPVRLAGWQKEMSEQAVRGLAALAPHSVELAEGSES